MSDIAIRVEGLSKQYRIGKRERYKTLRDTLTDTVTAPVRRLRSALRGAHGEQEENPGDLIWALKDVSFEVPHGAVVGVIGRNGAGKSTLLKILSRITEPTEGYAEVRGRVGSLLEVGTGFHPELTGRENIYLNGAILGMKRAEIEHKFDEIVAFAEVDKFIDTPVKHYSSGMYMRLAFAVAAHLEPEILIVDEVLAVGDAQFQKKCLGKMGEVAKEGRTVLFVSHNMTAVLNLCTEAICLRAGAVAALGSTTDVVHQYLQSATGTVSEKVWNVPNDAPGDEVVRLHRVAILPRHSEGHGLITVDTPLKVEVLYWNRRPGSVLNACIEVYSVEETCVFSSFAIPREYPRGLLRAVSEIPGGFLNASTYRIRAMVVRDTNTIVASESVSLDVHDTDRGVPFHGRWIGVVRPRLNWFTEVVSEDMAHPKCQDVVLK